MGLLGILLYSALFAISYSWVTVWILERREKKYGQGGISFSDAFLAGALTLILVYIANVFAFVRWPRSAGPFNVLLVTALAGFCLYRESVYKLEKKKADHRRRAEIRLLNIHIARDPANASYFSRLSDLHERLGEKKAATEAARMAVQLEPTERNRWKLKRLEE